MLRNLRTAAHSVFFVIMGLSLLLAGSATAQAVSDSPVQQVKASIGSRMPDRSGWYAGTLERVSPEQSRQALESRSMPPPSRMSPGDVLSQLAAATSSEYSQLAEALENDPRRIYQYVRNNVEYVPYFGSLKGAYLTLQERSGNDFDQSALLVELLRAAGYEAQYVFGIAAVPINDAVQIKQLADWLGVAEDVQIIADMLANGGVPVVLDGNILRFSRIWVEVVVDSSPVSLDPAFKLSSKFATIDLDAAMGYLETGLLSSSGGAVTPNSIDGMSDSGIDSYLTGLSTTLVSYLGEHHPNASVEEVLGGYKIIQDRTNVLPNVLPLSVAATDVWSTIPDGYAHTVQIEHGGIDITKRIQDIAGRKVSLQFYLGVALIFIDDQIEIQEPTLPLPGADNKLIVSVRHPYLAGNGSFADQIGVEYNVKRSGSYVLISGFGGEKHSTLIQERQRLLSRMSIEGKGENSRERISETLNIMGLSWMRQTQLNADIQSAIAGVRMIRHHRFGLMAQEEGYYIDVKAQAASIPKRSTAAKSGSFLSDGLFSSAMEHSVLEQLQGISNPGMSTIKIVTLNNAMQGRLFLLNSVNFDQLQSELKNYTGAEILKFEALVKIYGQTLVVPEFGTIELNDWVGSGHMAYFSYENQRSLGMIISPKAAPALNGGYATLAQRASPNVTQKKTTALRTPQKNIGRTPVSDPVDLRTGAFFSDITDLSLGGAGARGLSFTRSYDSQQASSDTALMGRGWTHNYNSYISRHSDVGIALGEQTPFAAASFIVANHVVRSLMEPEYPPIQNWGVSALVANWAMDQLLDRTTTVQVGTQALSYQEMPDGTYISPPGVTTKLVRYPPGGNFHVLLERFGAFTFFDENDQVLLYEDADGNQLNFDYSDRRLTTVTDMYGRNLTLTYSGDDLSSVSDSAGRTVYYNQNDEGNLAIAVGLEVTWWQFFYDSLQRLETVVNPSGVSIVDNTYDDFDRVIEQKAPRESGSGVYKMHYAGLLSSEEQPGAVRTRYYYDLSGRNVAIENALGDTTRAVFDGQGQLIRSRDPLGRETLQVYDGNNNVKEQISATNQRIAYQYDGEHRLRVTTDQLGHQSSIDYDMANHPTHVRDALGNEVVTTYRADGLPDTIKDPRATVTQFTYDNLGFTDTARTGAHPVIDQDYNDRGFLSRLTDQGGAVTSFVYDARGLVTQRTDPLGRKNAWAYDVAGRLTSHTDRNGDLSTLEYTDSGKLDAIHYSGSSVQFDYDIRDNLYQIVDPSGTTSNSFDALNRLTGHSDPNGYQVTYQYDAVGNLTQLTYPGNKRLSYNYDSLNRLVSVSIDWLSRTMTYQYDAANRLTDISHFNGMHTGITLDQANRLTGLVHEGSGVLASYSFALDENGNRIQEIARMPILPAGLINDEVTHNYNPQRNRLLSSSSDSFTYDNEGQQTQKSNVNYQFDAMHRLTHLGDNHSFNYDGVGNRIAATRNGVSTQYLHDAAGNLIAEANESGQITHYYIYGKGLAAMVTAGGAVYVYHFDGTGHTVAMTDSARVAVNRYAYSPYGEVLGEQETIPQPFKYAGQVGIFAEADNIYYMRARYYDAKTGRFISEDPAGFDGGINRYAYAGGNPAIYVDPNGQSPVLIGAIIGGVSGGISACLDGCDWKDVAIGVGTGAVSGAISPLAAARTVGAALFKGAVLSGGANAVGQGIDIAIDSSKSVAQNFNLGSFAGATLGGAFAGKLTKSHPISFGGQFSSGLATFGQTNTASLVGGAIVSGSPAGAQGGAGK